MIGPSVEDAAGHAHRKLGAVAMVLHRLDLDGAKACRVRDRGPRHPSENDRADDVHVRETPARPGCKSNGEIVDAICDAGRIHQVPGENEKRHGEEWK